MKKYLLMFLLLALLIMTGCTTILETVPLAPTNLQAVVQGEVMVKLTWLDNSTNEKEFNVYRGDSSEDIGILVATVLPNTVSYLDSWEIEQGKTYYYQVEATNSKGSLGSNIVSVTTPTPEGPAAPTNLVAHATHESVELSWQDNSDDEWSFAIYRGISADNLIYLANTYDESSYVDNNQIMEETTYYYQVEAVNGNGSARSPIISVITLGTTVEGRIIDRLGNPVEGMLIQLGDSKTTTDAMGIYRFDVEPSLYAEKMVGRGGKSAFYVVDTYLAFNSGLNKVADLIAYKVYGVGFVLQSYASEPQSVSLGTQRVKTFDLGSLKQEVVKSTLTKEQETFGARMNSYQPNSFVDLQNEISFIYLQWEPLGDWVRSYSILKVSDSSSEFIWSSNDSHPEDPAFDMQNPQAYLDLSSELYSVNGPGIYRFEVWASGEENGVSKYDETPEIAVPIGVTLGTYPKGITLGTDTLSWTEVVGSDGYRVQLYNNGRVYDSGPTLLQTTSIPVPDVLTAGNYYECYIDAKATDETGYVVEVTRGMTGFYR